MAKNSNTRKTHTSPGVYFSESVLNYSTRSLGITTLGVAGETLKGPAFQPITIESWRQYQNYFGGTSTEKYRGSQYPKYELPYIAKTYLEQSQQLEVVRVLGLSGVNAGPAWVVTATKHKTGTGYTYNSLSYEPTDMTENDWVEGENSFGIGEELPCNITNVSEQSPLYYRQVARIDRKEVECPENYNWNESAPRTYTEYEALAKDTHTYGYIRYQNGYTYNEVPAAPSGTDWKTGENAFCTFPTFVPDANSPQYIRVNCDKCAYMETSEIPSDVDFEPGINWFGNMDGITQGVTCDSSDYAKVSIASYKNVVTPYEIPDKDENNCYTVPIVYDSVVKVWNGTDYVEVSGIVTYNGVQYKFYKANNTINIWDGSSYTTFAPNTDCTNVGEYVYDGSIVYKREGNQYVSTDIVLSSDVDEYSVVNPLPAIVIDNTENEGKLYNYNNGYSYDFGTLATPSSSFVFDETNTYYATEGNPTGGAENWFASVVSYDDEKSRYCMVCKLDWTEVSDPSAEVVANAVNSYFNIPTENVGMYAKVISDFSYMCCGNCNMETAKQFVVSGNNYNVSIPTDGQTSTYTVNSLTNDEKNEIANFIFANGEDFYSNFVSKVSAYDNVIPEWIMIDSQILKLNVDGYKYYERTCDSSDANPCYYEAKAQYTYSTIISDDTYYRLTEDYKYYVLDADYTCFEVSPYYRYYAKVTGTKQLSEEDTECCEEALNTVVAVIRSRGEHKKAKFVRTPNAIDEANGICDDIYEYDGIEYYAKDVRLEASSSLKLGTSCTPGFSAETGDFTIDSVNYGRFTIVVTDNEDVEHRYPVSLNKSDNNYIYNVIGGSPEEGDTEVYVEELYDIALAQMIDEGKVNAINGVLAYYPETHIIPKYKNATDLMTFDDASLNKRYIGNRYLYSLTESIDTTGAPIWVRYSTNQGESWIEGKGMPGFIYRVVSKLNPETGKYDFFYGAYVDEINIDPVTGKVNSYMPSTKANFETEYLTEFDYDTDVDVTTREFGNCVKVDADDLFYIYTTVNGVTDVFPITLDLNNYKESFRFSSTPWIVSEMKGSANNVELTKLFRFHTISDGDNSIDEVKISIENIDPEYGTFDVLVRDFNDSDYNPQVIERYVKCNLVPGDQNYISLKIGSFDGAYESKSNYITVEVNETDLATISVPAGFLGYPIRDYSGIGIYGTPASDHALTSQPKMPWFRYNTNLDNELRPKKQYFGVSDLVGIDTDVLKYKGVEAYNGLPTGLTPCFHLDARILNGTPNNDGYVTVDGISQKVSVDGISGYTWSTVGRGNTTEAGEEPRIGDEATMRNTIYEDKRNRKFTVAFYGGFDGWDYYRTYRSNTDEFTYANYKGAINKTSGFGSTVNVLSNPEAFGLESEGKCLTTDYYAYLGAIRQFANPKTIDINVLATPGIDYVNNNLLVDEVVEMVEEERSDSLYVVTTPDKPFGTSDSQADMYSPDEAVANLEASELDTNRACTYYPWVKYYDDDNFQYIYLPVTRDVVKNIAYTDNIAYPWYAPAGYNRGSISGVSPKKKLKIGEQDTLYDGRINFVNSFAKEGDKIWGDKDLQIEENLMNRISKRRLMLRIKKLCENACIGLIFDPNDASMAKTLHSALKSVLDGVKSNRGIVDYRIEINSTPESRDRLELPATIFIQPTQTLERILIQAVATPQGVQFS